MDESIFSELPESHWTLAINDLEKVLPELASISDLFDFIPNRARLAHTLIYTMYLLFRARANAAGRLAPPM